MQLHTRTSLAKWSVALLGGAFFLVAVSWIVRSCLADFMAHMQTQLNLEAAVRLDPGSADCRMRLARAYQYDVRNVHPEKALEHLQRATQLSPHDPQAWIDMAAALEYQGKMAEAEVCLRRADLLAPNIPAFQWPIANFYLLQGKTDEAFRHLKVVLAGTSQHDQIVFSTAWKASADPEKLLEQLIPRRVSTEFSYLDFLLDRQRFVEAQAVWKRIVTSSERFPPQRCTRYLDTLIIARRPKEAYQVWKDLQSKGVILSTVSGTPDNMLDNGDFEDEVLNVGFAWRIVPVEGVYVGLDPTTFHSPSHALLVEFSGNQNLEWHNVFQYALVEPGRSYRLQGFVRAENITTDSGPRLRVYDAYDSAALDQLTEDVTGTTSGWTSLLRDFRTGPKTQLVVVALVRLPSRKLDNVIAGKVWLDDVQLTPLPE